MATEKWTAPGSWTDAFTASNLNSLANGNALAGNAIDNSGGLSIFADLGLQLASAAFVSPNFVGIYLYPRNKDDSTYGDNRFGSAAAGPPPTNYAVGTIGLVAATQAQYGMLTRIILPPGYFKFVLWNQGGVTWGGSSGNTCQYRLYDRAVA